MGHKNGRSNGFDRQDGDDLKELFSSRLESIEKATGLAASSLKERLESMNEFRLQMKDQMGTYITRNELDARLDSIKQDNRAGISLWISLMAILVSSIGIIINLII